MKKHNPLAILAVFVSTEMWERYGFYVVQSLLALFLALHFKLEEDEIYMLVGSFTALTYVSPILGGWLADHYLGQKKAILIGIVFLSVSYFMLAMATHLQALLSALAAIAVGTGLLKPNISALLGKQYGKNDKQRDSGFIIFYLGITVGIMLGTTVPSKLQENYGWAVCFLSASVGLVLAFIKFYFGSKFTAIKEQAIFKSNQWLNLLKAAVILLLTYALFFMILKTPSIATTFFIMISLFSAGIVLKIAFNEQGKQRRNTLSLLLLFVISIFFWAFYFQMFTTLTLFISHVVNPSLFGIHFPAPYFVAVQSTGIMVFGLILAKILPNASNKNVAYSVAKKFTLSIACLFLSYLMIWLTIKNNLGAELISILPLLAAYLVISFAELMLSPIGLSAVTKLANEKVVSTLMGVFFVSLGLGGFLSGQLAKLSAITGKHASIIEMKGQYLQAFDCFLLILAAAFILSCLLTKIIKHLGQGPK